MNVTVFWHIDYNIPAVWVQTTPTGKGERSELIVIWSRAQTESDRFHSEYQNIPCELYVCEYNVYIMNHPEVLKSQTVKKSKSRVQSSGLCRVTFNRSARSC